MPEGWTTVPIGDLCEVYDGPHATPPKTSDGPVFLGISNLNRGRLRLEAAEHVSEDDFRRWTRRVAPRADDVVFSYETRLGEAARIPDGLRCCLGRRLGLLRPRADAVDPRFLLYAYLGPEFQGELLARTMPGSTVDRIFLTDLPEFPIRVPALPTQRAIGRLLGALDYKIDLLAKRAATLEEIARTLFRSWFEDFDPVRGTATVPNDVRRLFPDRLVDSPIGPVPEGWQVVPLGEHFEVTRGLSYTGAGLADEGMPLHNLNSIREGGGYKEDGIKHYVGEFRRRDRVRPGDVIVANTEQGFGHLLIGYPAIVPRSFGDDGLYSQDLSRVRPLDGSPLTCRWLYLLLVGRRMHHMVAGYSNGTTVNHLALDGLKKPLIAVPSHELVERFDAIVAPMFAQQEALTAESKTLAELRDTLLPELLSGRIRLADVGAKEI